MDLIASAQDRVVLFIKQMLNGANQRHVFRAIVTAVAPFGRAQLRELLLPETQHGRIHAD